MRIDGILKEIDSNTYKNQLSKDNNVGNMEEEKTNEEMLIEKTKSLDIKSRLVGQ